MTAKRIATLDQQNLANQGFFDRWAQNYDDGRIAPWFRYTQRLAMSMMEIKPDSKVLDVGCGTGFAVVQLAMMLPEGKACGIDISAKMIAIAEANVPKELETNVEFRQASSSGIPYEEGEFDYIMCTNSFHHYPEPLEALNEMRRVLKPGGQLVILDNAVDRSLYTWAWDRVLRIVEKGHVRYYSSQELGGMITRAGFEQTQLRYLKNEFLKHGKRFASLQVWSGRNPGSNGAAPATG